MTTGSIWILGGTLTYLSWVTIQPQNGKKLTQAWMLLFAWSSCTLLDPEMPILIASIQKCCFWFSEFPLCLYTSQIFSGHPHFDYLDSHLILTIISAAHLPSLGPLPPRIVFVQGFYLCKAIRFQNLIGGRMEILDISNDQKWFSWEKSVTNDGYILIILINRSFVAWV